MPEPARSLASYRAVSSSEPSTICTGEHHTLPHVHDGGPSQEDQGSRGHQASHLIPRKPVSHNEKNSRGAGVNEDEQYADTARDPSTRSSDTGIFEVFSIWWLEMVCCAIFSGAFLAIVATIYSYEGRPLPEWPYHLTINTLIAIYVVILKAALLLVTAQGLGQLKWRWFDRDRPLKHLTNFDAASRGALGSLTLLWMLKGRHIIASCGALITVAALLIDPFAQQVISTYQCMLDVQSSQATIPRTNLFSESGPHVGAGETALPIDLQKTINAGIFNPGTSVAFGCPSGNCTFPDVYHSVGYCSSCNDITSYLLVIDEIVPGGPNYTNVSLPGYWQEYPGGGGTFWSPPVTAILNGTDTGSGNATYDSNTAYLTMDYFAGAVVASQINNPLSTSCSNGSQTRWGCAAGAASRAGAANCTIVPCVRSYKASIEGGSLSEEVASPNNLWTWDTLNFDPADLSLKATINLACLPLSTRTQLSKLDFKLEENGWLSTPNLTTIYTGSSNFPTAGYWVPSMDETFPNISIPAECVYLYDAVLTDRGIQTFLNTYLNGTVGISPQNGYSYDYAGAAQLLAIYNESYLSFEDLSSIFANISDSLTTHIRQNGVQNFSTPVHGTVLHEQTCVHVRWAWLAYPAVLVGLTLIFLTGMIFETRMGDGRSHDWKSEPLALMFHRLDDETIKTTGGVRLVKRKDMQDAAARVSVRLAKTADGWGFVDRDDDGMKEAFNADGWRESGHDGHMSSSISRHS